MTWLIYFTDVVHSLPSMLNSSLLNQVCVSETHQSCHGTAYKCWEEIFFLNYYLFPQQDLYFTALVTRLYIVILAPTFMYIGSSLVFTCTHPLPSRCVLSPPLFNKLADLDYRSVNKTSLIIVWNTTYSLF